jgi:hypothetical protein
MGHAAYYDIIMGVLISINNAERPMEDQEVDIAYWYHSK